MQRRDRIDIIYDMLTSVQANRGRMMPTRLMYKANMTHGQMKLYLDELLTKDFLKKETDKRHTFLVLTDNGHRFIQKIREMKEFESAFGI